MILTNVSTFQGLAGSTTNIRGTITNNGAINVMGAFVEHYSSIGTPYWVDTAANIILDNGSVTLTGPGTLNMGAAFYFNDTISSQDPSWILTNDTYHKITGSGYIGGSSGMGIVNKGTIVANPGDTLYIQASAAGVSNTGLMEANGGSLTVMGGSGISNTSLMQAVNGGQLSLSNVNSNTGTIQALAGSTVDLNIFDNTGGTTWALAGTVDLINSSLVNTGGTIQALNGGTLQLNGGTFDITNGIQAQNNSLIQLTGGAYVRNTALTADGSSFIQNLGSATLDNVILTNVSTFQGLAGSTTNIRGTITNNGAINVMGAFVEHYSSIGTPYWVDTAANIILDNGSVTLTGPGTLNMGAAFYFNDTISSQDPSWILTNDTYHKITGSGYIGGSSGMGIVNKGTIVANPGDTLYIQASAAGVSNTGLMEANGGSLTVMGGSGISNTSLMQAVNGGQLSLSNVNSNTGTIQALAGSTVDLNIFDNTGGTLNNYGWLYNNGILNNAMDGLLNNYSGSTLINSSTLNNNGGVLTNSGTLANNGTLSNSGTLNNMYNGIINGTGNYNQTAGQTKNMGSLTQTSINIQGGILSGTGQIFAPVTIRSGGTISPGDAPGTLTINGNFYSSGNLLFEIGGLGSGQYSMLDINGNATFTGGNITFDFINGYRPLAGNSWNDFLLANTITGLNTLTPNVEGLGAGLGYNFNPLTDSLSISSASSVPVPPTIILLGTGLIGLVGVRRRFKN